MCVCVRFEASSLVSVPAVIYTVGWMSECRSALGIPARASSGRACVRCLCVLLARYAVGTGAEYSPLSSK